MTRLLMSLVLLAGGPSAPGVAGQDTSTSSPQIMVLGTYHMSNPGADDTNVEADDVRSPHRQREIEAVVDALAGFAPTRIAVELTPDRQERLDAWYSEHRAGELSIETSELDQIAFRLAERLGHERLYAVDHAAGLDIEGVAEAAARGGQEDLVRRARELTGEAARRIAEIQEEATVGAILRYLNSPAFDATHGFYLAMTPVRDGESYAGAEMTAAWYERNLKIFANVWGLVEGPDERVLVLIGAGHGTLLRRFVADFPDAELVSALDHLPADGAR